MGGLLNGSTSSSDKQMQPKENMKADSTEHEALRRPRR